MAKYSCFALIFVIAVVAGKSMNKREASNNFNYHYEKSGELLKTAASNLPYPQYDAAESNFGNSGPYLGSGLRNQGFNQNFGFSSPSFGFGGYSGGYLNNPGFQSGGYIQQRPYLSGGLGGYHDGHYGGGYVDRNQYNSAKKNVGDENLEKVEAKSGNNANQESQEYNQGAVQQSNAKGDTGYYKDEVANKNQIGDGKQYQAQSNFDKAGKNGQSENAQKNHKKGHVTKGFKSSHKKDEEEKTETFYDEAHDEADHKNFGQNQGSFGEQSESSIKGGHEKESLDAKAQGKEGHYNSHNKYDDSKANKGEYGQNAYKGNSEQFRKVNGLDAQSILGQQEVSGEFQGKKPYSILPINP